MAESIETIWKTQGTSYRFGLKLCPPSQQNRRVSRSGINQQLKKPSSFRSRYCHPGEQTKQTVFRLLLVIQTEKRKDR